MTKEAKARVLFIEDDVEVARSTLEGLTRHGLSLCHAPTIAAAGQRLDGGNFDAIVLDLTLPDGNGLDFAAALRRDHIATPILMLTAKDAVTDRINGFRYGADDYLCKPFDVTELAARLFAIMRRTHPARRHVIGYAEIELDLVTRTAQRGDTTVTLSAREAELLAYLIRHNEEALSRNGILREVWRDEAEDVSNVLNVYINYLRNKIDSDPNARLIHTVRGVGYMLSRYEPEELAHRRGE